MIWVELGYMVVVEFVVRFIVGGFVIRFVDECGFFWVFRRFSDML